MSQQIMKASVNSTSSLEHGERGADLSLSRDEAANKMRTRPVMPLPYEKKRRTTWMIIPNVRSGFYLYVSVGPTLTCKAVISEARDQRRYRRPVLDLNWSFRSEYSVLTFRNDQVLKRRTAHYPLCPTMKKASCLPVECAPAGSNRHTFPLPL